MKMLLKISGLTLFLLLSVFAAPTIQAQTAAEPGMHFHHGTWAEALAKAKKENKLVFVDAYASWCGPCRMMSSQVFVDESVGNFYNKNFVNVKMDMEKGEGPGLARTWGIRAYPTLMVFNGDGKEVYRQLGGLRVPDFLNFGQQGLAAGSK
ncbi:MAG: thioredoxin family protein [Bacteroidia bacterium]|nr:thioredoxin family protein [Bacteroidia bacterium]